jgi:hypothetical protein
MPKLIKKNENYFIRAPYDFALRPEGVNELFSKGIEVDDVFDKGFFNYLCDKNYVAIFTDDIERKSNAEDCINEENLEEDVSDSLNELVDLISHIQKRYERHGINLEIIIKQKPRE